MTEWICKEKQMNRQGDGATIGVCLAREKELVRCKDCKHGCDWDDGRWKCIINGGMHAPDWFCADGERRIE